MTAATLSRPTSATASAIIAAANARHNSITFPVAFRPLKMNGRQELADVPQFQAVARMKDDAPVCLGVVSKSYGLLKNADVLADVEGELVRHLPPQAWDGAKILDTQSYDGAFTQRQYRFPGLPSQVFTDSGFSTRACLQFTFRNGYDGSTGVFLGGGLLDLICTNGLMAVRWSENVTRRHTRHVAAYPFADMVLKTITRYGQEVAELNRLGKVRVTDEQAKEFLAAHFEGRRVDHLLTQFMRESATRGRNAFALLSALTFYSSHSDGDFKVRNRGNDNQAASLAKRQDEVASIVQGKGWREFAQAA